MSNFQQIVPNPIPGSGVEVNTLGEYAMPFFIEGEQRLRMMVSKDNVVWNEPGGILFSPGSGDLRDPDMYYSDTNGLYYIAFTSGTFGAANYFTIISSPDLIHWTDIVHVSTASISGVIHTWSPTWFTDSDGSLHIIVSCDTSASGVSPINMQPYEVHPTNAALTTWSAPVAITGSGIVASGVAVGMILKSGTYYLWYQKFVSPGNPAGNTQTQIASSSSFLSGYADFKTGNWAGWGVGPVGSGGVEAARPLKNPSGTWTIWLNTDLTGGPQSSTSTNDWSTWSSRAYINSPNTQVTTGVAGVFLAKNLTNIQDVIGYVANTLAITGNFPRGIALGNGLPSRYTNNIKYSGIFVPGGCNSGLIGTADSNFQGLFINANIVMNATVGDLVLQDTTKPGWLIFESYGSSVDGIVFQRAASGQSGALSLTTPFGIFSNYVNLGGGMKFAGTGGTAGQVPISNSSSVPTWSTPAALTQAVMTSNQTGTITFNNSGNSETIYNTSATLIGAATITLPTTSTPGQIVRYASAGVITTVTMAGGTVDIGAALTTLAANGSVAWQSDTNGHWVRLY